MRPARTAMECCESISRRLLVWGGDGGRAEYVGAQVVAGDCASGRGLDRDAVLRRYRPPAIEPLPYERGRRSDCPAEGGLRADSFDGLLDRESLVHARTIGTLAIVVNSFASRAMLAQ